jgi:hypothetical protein
VCKTLRPHPDSLGYRINGSSLMLGITPLGSFGTCKQFVPTEIVLSKQSIRGLSVGTVLFRIDGRYSHIDSQDDNDCYIHSKGTLHLLACSDPRPLTLFLPLGIKHIAPTLCGWNWPPVNHSIYLHPMRPAHRLQGTAMFGQSARTVGLARWNGDLLTIILAGHV